MLTFQQWKTPQVTAVQPQKIEGVVVLRTSASHQIVELRRAVSAQVDDLAVQDHVVGSVRGGR
ncbi:MAG: hypothetical protein ABI759_24165 [Candidatus Solibacter sp.]